MTLRQRICGFLGHKSVPYKAISVRRGITHCRLFCTKCGFKTKWFDLVNDADVSDNFKDRRDTYIGDSNKRCECGFRQDFSHYCDNQHGLYRKW